MRTFVIIRRTLTKLFQSSHYWLNTGVTTNDYDSIPFKSNTVSVLPLCLLADWKCSATLIGCCEQRSTALFPSSLQSCCCLDSVFAKLKQTLDTKNYVLFFFFFSLAAQRLHRPQKVRSHLSPECKTHKKHKKSWPPLPCDTCMTLLSLPCPCPTEDPSERDKKKVTRHQSDSYIWKTHWPAVSLLLLDSVAFRWCDARSTSLSSIPMRSPPCHTDQIH